MKESRQRESAKTIRTFALASFLNDLGSDMIYPIWPLFMTSFLNVNMSVLGFIDGLGDAVVSISQAASGYLSDRLRKRKIFIWTGYLFGSVSRIGYALSTVWQHLIPYRILDRAGKIRSAPRDAIIADISTKENRGTHFGILRAMDNLGAVFGITLCIVLFHRIGYQAMFVLASIPSAIGALLIIFSIQERKTQDIIIYKGLTFKDLDANFFLFLILSAFFALGSFSYSFLLIYAKRMGFKVAFVPVLFLIFTAVAALFSIPFGRLSDRIGRKKVLMLSFVLWITVCAILIIIKSFPAVILAFIMYGLHKAALDTVQKALVSELAPAKYRASTLGGFQMVIGLCALPASLLAGVLWDSIDIYAPFIVSIGLTVLSVVMLIFVKER